MRIWKAILVSFGVTISIGLLVGGIFWLNSGKKIDKSQQEIKQEKITQAQSKKSNESRVSETSSTEEVTEYETDENVNETTSSSENTINQEENHDMGDFYEDPYLNGENRASNDMSQDEYYRYMIGEEFYTDSKGIIWNIVYFRKPGTEAWGQATLATHQDNVEVMEKIQKSAEYQEYGYISRPQMLKQYLDSKNWDE